ncbi:MAG: P-loop NTPase fold protein, partial [Pseudomonadales bacterium]
VSRSGLGAGVAGAGALGFLWILAKEWKQISAQPLAKELKTYLRLPSYGEHLGTIPVMKEQIEALCKIRLGKKGGKHRRLLFVVDDLDRCGIDGIVKTFEAVRLILELENVVVIIAVDQRIALPALACHYEKLSKHHQHDPKSIARDYLAKVITLPVHLPEPDDTSVAGYLANYLWKDESFIKVAEAMVNSERERQSAKEKTATEQTGDNDKGTQLAQEKAADKGEKPKETLDDILRDVESFDIAALLRKDTSTRDEANVNTKQGLSPDQKRAFYYWLLAFNLRNPRQIKRLYNSYNILQDYYDGDKPTGKNDHAFPYMVSLFALEMINQEIRLAEGKSPRQRAKDYLFNGSSEELFTIPTVSAESIDLAKKIIEETGKTSLQEQVEPFVLPSIELEKSDEKE